MRDAAEVAAVSHLSPWIVTVGQEGDQGWYRVSDQLQMWICLSPDLFPARSLAFCPAFAAPYPSVSPFLCRFPIHSRSWIGRRCSFVFAASILGLGGSLTEALTSPASPLLHYFGSK